MNPKFKVGENVYRGMSEYKILKVYKGSESTDEPIYKVDTLGKYGSALQFESDLSSAPVSIFDHEVGS